MYVNLLYLGSVSVILLPLFGAVTLMIYSVDKGWAAWSAWHSSQLSVRRMCVSTQMEKRRAVETLVFHKLTIEQRTFNCCTKLSKKYR